MSTTSKSGRHSLPARALAAALGLVLARPAAAAPAPAAAAPVQGESLAAAAPARSEGPATVEAALETGDLGTARTLAEQARVADPSPENWRREAEVCTRQADFACARAAWQGHLAALPKGADRGPAEAALRALEDRSRGTVEDEAPSTHRAELDQARADREAALRPKPKATPAPKPSPPKRERIVKKWYFWVTTIAIAAAAGAITGIAIQAARDERADDLDENLRAPAGPPPSPPQGFGLRF